MYGKQQNVYIKHCEHFVPGFEKVTTVLPFFPAMGRASHRNAITGPHVNWKYNFTNKLGVTGFQNIYNDQPSSDL